MTLNSLVDAITSHVWESLAILLGLVAIWQAHRANRFARIVAKKQGSFNQPQLTLRMFGHSDIKQFILLVPLQPPPLLFPLPLNIQNHGSATATAIRLIVRGNEDLLPYSQEWLAKQQDPSGVVMATFQGKEGHVNQIMYHIPTLHPGMPLNLVNTAVLRTPTQVSDKVSFQAADGVRVTLPYKLEFGYRLDVVLFQEDSKPVAESFRLKVLDTSDCSALEALERYWENRAQRRETIQPSRSRWRWSWRSSPFKTLYVITVNEAKVPPKTTQGFREVPVQALVGAEGIEDADGLFVPALGVELGNFQGTLRRLPKAAAEESSPS